MPTRSLTKEERTRLMEWINGSREQSQKRPPIIKLRKKGRPTKEQTAVCGQIALAMGQVMALAQAGVPVELPVIHSKKSKQRVKKALKKKLRRKKRKDGKKKSEKQARERTDALKKIERKAARLAKMSLYLARQIARLEGMIADFRTEAATNPKGRKEQNKPTKRKPALPIRQFEAKEATRQAIQETDPPPIIAEKKNSLPATIRETALFNRKTIAKARISKLQDNTGAIYAPIPVPSIWQEQFPQLAGPSQQLMLADGLLAGGKLYQEGSKAIPLSGGTGPGLAPIALPYPLVVQAATNITDENKPSKPIGQNNPSTNKKRGLPKRVREDGHGDTLLKKVKLEQQREKNNIHPEKKPQTGQMSSRRLLWRNRGYLEKQPVNWVAVRKPKDDEWTPGDANVIASLFNGDCAGYCVLGKTPKRLYLKIGGLAEKDIKEKLRGKTAWPLIYNSTLGFDLSDESRNILLEI